MGRTPLNENSELTPNGVWVCYGEKQHFVPANRLPDKLRQDLPEE